MPYQPVEWVLVVYYGPSAHRATYGRLSNTKYTKDYIQLSRTSEFKEVLADVFPGVDSGSYPLTYHWLNGTTTGAIVYESADRPHLKWETSLGAPKAWRMTPSPTPFTAETIPGEPFHEDFDSAEEQLARLQERGAGQPYLVAVKLKGESGALHLRCYLKAPGEELSWASTSQLPAAVYSLIDSTRQSSALASRRFDSRGVSLSGGAKHLLSRINDSPSPDKDDFPLDGALFSELSNYLTSPSVGLFFDPTSRCDAWWYAPLPSEELQLKIAQVLQRPTVVSDLINDSDAVAEVADIDYEQIALFRDRLNSQDYRVPDALATVKTRGSAQRVFAENVKSNYGFACAATGIRTREFLVAAHIVPWSIDESIRLDPQNGICLSLIVDRAFEKGYIVIDDELVMRVNHSRIGNDVALLEQLAGLDGRPLRHPREWPPRVELLQRRRVLVGWPN